tara:strand:+ start:57 stop:407 length:351 start_codon:yes stop_codon:yes gene_type:complete
MMMNTHNMKSHIYNIDGDIVKSDNRYEIIDNTKLNNLVLSKTRLRAKQSTNGHRHLGQEEIYFFIEGVGRMEIDHKEFKVQSGDIVSIEDNAFHRVHNDGDFFLDFICVFEGSRSH